MKLFVLNIEINSIGFETEYNYFTIFFQLGNL